jgi:hypothetical protein
LKWLSIVDEYTRECLALEVDRSITAEKVIDVLVDLFRIRGVPKHIRSDNGPEFIAQVIRRWLTQAGVETLYVEPGSPWENGCAIPASLQNLSRQAGDEGIRPARHQWAAGGPVAVTPSVCW